MALNLLIAPPGWGKTYKLLNWIKTSPSPCVFVFPLRALCEEVYQSALERRISCFCLRSWKDREVYQKMNSKLLIATPELLQGISIADRIVLVDEFHLFFYWGESFRESMYEFMEEHLDQAKEVIFLSATISTDIKEKINNLFSTNYSELRIWDFGNQKLKNMPKAVLPYFSKSDLMKAVYYNKRRGTGLIFCQYRKEVNDLADELRGRGFSVISCVGGEAYEFSLKLFERNNWDFIVATTVVSHGVNLPVISEIFFTYKIKNLDFYLQMVGRAGRDGSDFRIHTLCLKYFKSKLYLKGIMQRVSETLSQRCRYLLYCYDES